MNKMFVGVILVVVMALLIAPAFANKPGDINGDGKVDLRDLIALANAWGSKPGDAKWNPNADLFPNGIIDIRDLVVLAHYYGT